MKADQEIQRDVMEEIAFDPAISSKSIQVSVKNQVVTLSGTVPTYWEKHAAEKAAFRVGGVRVIAEEIEVKLHESFVRTDQEIAEAAANALKWNVALPATIYAKVEMGQIYLRGMVDWGYQRELAAATVRPLKGVKEVVNDIQIQTRLQPDDIKEKIEKALLRSAADEAQHIQVEIADDKVILTGSVSSRTEIEDAETAAWAVPGVKAVENNLSLA